jgi:pyruvate/2-oxoglutarate dehydrogenase complex dihydrolipoamide dehydrogenase (E3) component
VALIERDRMGGTRLHAGAVPTSALLAAARAAASARTAGRFGISLPEPAIDWNAVRAHVQGTIATLAPDVSEARYRALGATVIREEARFAAPDALLAGGRRITARRIVIAAGSRPAIPPVQGLESIPFLTSETLFGLAERLVDCPGHLLILGGGAHALELAEAHAALGCRVTLIEVAQIAAGHDPELVEGLRMSLRRQGVTLIEGITTTRIEPGPTAMLTDGRRISGSHLLVMAGRQPNVGGLGLDAGGLHASVQGIATDAGLRSLTNRRVFAAGSIADPRGIGPRGQAGPHHAGIVIRRAVFHLPARLDTAFLPRVIRTHMELAQAGMTEAEARAAGHQALRILRWPLAENEQAIAEACPEGLVKLVATPRGQVLGAGILAPHAAEMIGAWILAITRRVPLPALAALEPPCPARAGAAARAAGLFVLDRLNSTYAKRFARLLARLP